MRALLGTAVLVAAMGAAGCRVPGPTHWPTERQAARHARAVGLEPAPSWARGVIEALAAGHGESVADTLASSVRTPQARAVFARASRRARVEFGPVSGIVESRVHHEAEREWFTALVVHGRGPHRRLVLYQLARETDQLVRVLVRAHPFRERVLAPATGYQTVNRFRFPARGAWEIIQGGHGPTLNKHYGHPEQRFAYDAVVKRQGRTRSGHARANEAYYAYGEPVLAPAPGVVVFARDNVPDNAAGARGRGGGNGVAVDHGFGEVSYLWHLAPGSVRVRAGDRVQWGQEVGRVGNGGNSSQPHIHFHVASGPPGSRPIALPAALSDVWIDDVWHRSSIPAKGQRARAQERDPAPGRPREHPAIILDW